MINNHKNRPTRDVFKMRCQYMYKDLCDKIDNGDFGSSQFLESEADLGKKYFLSRSSVRDIISQLVEQGMVSRIKGKGIMVGAIDSGREISGVVAVFLNGWDRNIDQGVFYQESPRFRATLMLDSIESEFNDRGVRMKLVGMQERTKEEMNDLFKRESYFGVLFINADDPGMDKLIKLVDTMGVPGVAIGGVSQVYNNISSVSYNNYQVGRIGVEYLYEQGHRRVVFISNPNYYWAVDRKRGYEDFCEQAVDLHDGKIIEYDLGNKEAEWIELGRRGAEEVLAAGDISAVFCVNDAVSKGFFEVANAKGLNIPEDISVVSCDNNYDYHDLDLSSIKLNCSDVARNAAKLVSQYLSKHSSKLLWPMNLKIQPSLIKRGSVKEVREESVC